MEVTSSVCEPVTVDSVLEEAEGEAESVTKLDCSWVEVTSSVCELVVAIAISVEKSVL